VALAALLVVVTSRSLPRPATAPFDPQPLERLRRARPEFVLLGNSMVGTRFDERTLRRSLRPHRISVLALSGSASAAWYLALKNVVVASGHRPRVILFFREQELTEPHKWVTAPKARRKLEQLWVGDEPLVERKLAPRPTDFIDRIEWYRKRAVPLENWRVKTEPLVERAGELGSNLIQKGPSPRLRKRQINKLFALRNLRGADGAAEQAPSGKPQVFEEELAQSFLPDIFELTKANGIPLTFVRVRTRAAASGAAKTASEQRYDSALERYLLAQGAEFYDMHDADWESIDMYGEGDHIAGRLTRRYSQLFVEHMSQIFH